MKKSVARSNALANKVRYYVPEQPCARGHLMRRVSDGTCVECKRMQEHARVCADRAKYCARKQQERVQHLPLIAARAAAARANETPSQRAVRLEKARIKQREWRINNPKHTGAAAAKKRYKLNNPHKVRADTVKRRVTKMQRTPQWLSADDLWMLEQAYDIAALRTRLFCFKWHVDHIIPLQGRRVSGLHVPNNIQVIPALANLAKANKYTIL